MSMRLFFVINVFLAFLWAILMQSLNIVDFLIGFVIGFAIMSLVDPQYSTRGVRIPMLLLYVLWDVFVSSLVVAGYILHPNPNMRQGIIAVPLDVTAPVEIAALASIITLTPGTMTVDLGKDMTTGQQVLFVHALNVHEPEELVKKIKDGFERKILQITRGAV